MFLCNKLTRSLTHALLFITPWTLFSVNGSFQARILVWIAVSFFRKKLTTAHLITPILLLFEKSLTQSYGTYDHYF